MEKPVTVFLFCKLSSLSASCCMGLILFVTTVSSSLPLLVGSLVCMSLMVPLPYAASSDMIFMGVLMTSRGLPNIFITYRRIKKFV